jgi:hypothetical protein
MTQEEFVWTKQAGHIWNKHLHKGLVKLGFQESTIDECVYYQGSTILLCCVDDTILINPDNEAIEQVICELKDLKFNVTDEGQIKDYLGVRIKRLSDGKIKMSQPHLIQQILEDLNLKQRNCNLIKPRYQTESQDIPAPSTATPMGYQLRTTQRELVLLISHWQAQLPREVLTSGFSIHSSQHSQVLFRPKDVTFASSQTYWTLSSWY